MSTTCYTLVGLPGSGKSTFRKSQIEAGFWDRNILVNSLDDYIHAHRGERSYLEAFPLLIDEASAYCDAVMSAAASQRLSVVVDRTNLTRRHRQLIYAALPHHNHVCVWIDPPEVERQFRMEQRKDQNIPEYILKGMERRFEAPNVEREPWFSFVSRVTE